MWNYRIGTKIEPKTKERTFFVFECYYDKKTKVPNGYPERIDVFEFPNPLANWTTLKDLQGTYELIIGAFDKPIIDLDNWPNEYVKVKKKRKV